MGADVVLPVYFVQYASVRRKARVRKGRSAAAPRQIRLREKCVRVLLWLRAASPPIGICSHHLPSPARQPDA
jgi:hypothetical protein